LKSRRVLYLLTPRTKKVAEKRAKKLYFWEEGLRRALTLDRDDSKAAENITAWRNVVINIFK
jgi:hypothetical protein